MKSANKKGKNNSRIKDDGDGEQSEAIESIIGDNEDTVSLDNDCDQVNFLTKNIEYEPIPLPTESGRTNLFL